MKKDMKQANGELQKVEEKNVEVPANKIPVRKKILIAVPVLFDIIYGGVYLSMIAPFFPDVALKKGLNTGQQSFVFIAPEVVGVFSTFFWGKVTPLLGVKNLWFTGVIATGITSGIFGSLEYIHDGNAFLIACVIIRILEGLAGYAIIVTGSTILIGLLPEHAGTMLTMADSMFALGFAVGPFFGSITYNQIGFFFTFLINAVIIILSGIVGLIVIPKSMKEDKNKAEWIKYLGCPKVWIPIILIINGGFSDFYFQNILSVHLESMDVSITDIGAIYSGSAIAFGITTIFLSYLGETKPILIPFMNVIGLLSTSVIYLFFGPAHFLHLHNHNQLARLISCFALLGVTGSTFTVNYSTLSNLASELGIDLNITTKSMISAIAAGCFSIGIVLGEIPSGYINEYCGFGCASTVIFAIEAGLAGLLTLYYLVQYFRQDAKFPRLLSSTKTSHGYATLHDHRPKENDNKTGRSN